MDTKLNYSEIIKKVLCNYAKLFVQLGVPPKRTLFADNEQNFMVLDIGWYGNKYIHNATIHIEIIDHKLWIHNDDTEDGIADDLVEAGIPAKDIVLGFRHPKVRPHTQFAVE